MVALDTGRDVDEWKRVATKAPVDFEAIREARQQANQEPDWLQEWPDREEVPAPPGCIRPGCPEPCGPGDTLLCVAHRAGATVPAIAGGSE
jgi:hypothetical protein